MKARSLNWRELEAKLRLFNDNEKVLYLHQIRNDLPAIQYITATGNKTPIKPTHFLHTISSKALRLLTAKIFRKLIQSQSELNETLSALDPADRAQFNADQEDFWVIKKLEDEEAEIEKQINTIKHQRLLIPGKETGPHPFRDRLAAINFTGEIPVALTCPISGQLMEDPISMSSGKFFDRPCITAWFDSKAPLTEIPCPQTTLPIKREELKFHTNTDMLFLIEEFVKGKEEEARQQKSAKVSRVSSFFSDSPGSSRRNAGSSQTGGLFDDAAGSFQTSELFDDGPGLRW